MVFISGTKKEEHRDTRMGPCAKCGRDKSEIVGAFICGVLVVICDECLFEAILGPSFTLSSYIVSKDEYHEKKQRVARELSYAARHGLSLYKSSEGHLSLAEPPGKLSLSEPIKPR